MRLKPNAFSLHRPKGGFLFGSDVAEEEMIERTSGARQSDRIQTDIKRGPLSSATWLKHDADGDTILMFRLLNATQRKEQDSARPEGLLTLCRLVPHRHGLLHCLYTSSV